MLIVLKYFKLRLKIILERLFVNFYIAICRSNIFFHFQIPVTLKVTRIIMFQTLDSIRHGFCLQCNLI